MTVLGLLFWFLVICWFLSKVDTTGRGHPPPVVNVQVTVINTPYTPQHTSNNELTRRF